MPHTSSLQRLGSASGGTKRQRDTSSASAAQAAAAGAALVAATAGSGPAAPGAAASGGSAAGSNLARSASAPAPRRSRKAATGAFDAARLQLQQGSKPDDFVVRTRPVLSCGKIRCTWRQLQQIRSRVAGLIRQVKSAVNSAFHGYSISEAQQESSVPADADVVKSTVG
ncbi:hypothetical protein ABPG75_008802 [Micractinium tetrahymenae]